ncbi:MAG TPA: MFS transporter [Bacillota bacterium]
MEGTTIAVPAALPTSRRYFNASLVALTAGHVVVDLNQGALPALLPWLEQTQGYAYGQLGLLLTVFFLTSSFVQPLCGYLSDRGSRQVFVPAGIVLAPLGMTVIALAPRYGLLVAGAVLMGIGSASYHPEATRTAARLAGGRQGLGMAMWILGGNLGLALGPLYLTAAIAMGSVAVAAAGLTGLGAVLAGLVAADARLRAAMGPTAAPAATDVVGQKVVARRPRPDPRGSGGGWTVIALATAMVAARTATLNGLLAFLPFYYVDVLGGPAAWGPWLQSALLFGAVAGTFTGGGLSDRYGVKRVLIIASLATLPLVLLVLVGRGLVALACLFALGAALAGMFTLAVVVGQQAVPQRASLAAACTNGVGLGLGGAAAGLLGLVADHWGLGWALGLLPVFPLLGLILAWLLPGRFPAGQAPAPGEQPT